MSRKVVEDHSLEFFCLFRCANTKISYVVALSSDRVSLRSYSVPGLVTPDLHLVWSHLYFLTVTLDSGESPGKFTTVKGGSSLPTVKTLGLSYPRGVQSKRSLLSWRTQNSYNYRGPDLQGRDDYFLSEKVLFLVKKQKRLLVGQSIFDPPFFLGIFINEFFVSYLCDFSSTYD